MKFLNQLCTIASRIFGATTRAATAAAEPIGFRELLLFGGALLLAIGMWPVYPPASFLIPGAILVYVSVFGTA